MIWRWSEDQSWRLALMGSLSDLMMWLRVHDVVFPGSSSWCVQLLDRERGVS
jgi:hypothetical protein